MGKKRVLFVDVAFVVFLKVNLFLIKQLVVNSKKDWRQRCRANKTD